MSTIIQNNIGQFWCDIVICRYWALNIDQCSKKVRNMVYYCLL